jgi:preprotein translocase subunit SecE
MIHTLLVLFIVLCIVGVILYGIQQIPGLPPTIKTVVVVIVCVLLLLAALNYVNGGGLRLR